MAYTHDIGKVEDLAEEISGSVAIVQVQGFHDVLGQFFEPSLTLRLRLQYGTSHTIGYYPHFTLLPLLPHPVRNVEKHALEEQHERHPLVIRVILLLPVVDTQAWMSHLGAHVLRVVLRQCKRVRNPAIRVDHMSMLLQIR